MEDVRSAGEAEVVDDPVPDVSLHVGLHVGVHTSTLHADCQAEQEAGQCGLVSHVSHLTSLLTTGQTDDGERIYRGGPR